MKKLSFFALLFILFSLFSCSKKNDIVAPQDESQLSEQPATVADESATKQVSWDQLPAELKNATPLPTESEQVKEGAARPLNSFYRYIYGPWGSNYGYPYYFYPPYGSKIYAIAFGYGSYINKITIWYLINGSLYVAHTGGNHDGFYVYYRFSYNEYIYRISGRAGNYLNYLKIYTNKRYFSFGGSGGNWFDATVSYGYQVLGFYGKYSNYINKFGFYAYPR